MKNLLKPDMFVEEIEEGIYTSIISSGREHEYDEKAGFYDVVIGNSLYNRILWGNQLSDYQNFCYEALMSRSTGYVLDAGCGSLVFTAKVYKQYKERPLILLDRSLGMLKKAKARLIDKNGKIPENITLWQSGLFTMPFREGVFETVQSFGMLHIFSDTQGFIQTLLKMKSKNGGLYFTSLVGNNWIGMKYLHLLQSAGEVASIHTSESLTRAIAKMKLATTEKTIGNMAYYSC